MTIMLLCYIIGFGDPIIVKFGTIFQFQATLELILLCNIFVGAGHLVNILVCFRIVRKKLLIQNRLRIGSLWLMLNEYVVCDMISDNATTCLKAYLFWSQSFLFDLHFTKSLGSFVGQLWFRVHLDWLCCSSFTL